MLCALLIFLAQSTPASAPPLTVTAAIALARQHNPDIEEARAAVDAARASMTSAESIYRPSFAPRFAGAIGGDSANQQYGVELSQRFRTGTRFSASVNSSSSRNQLGTYFNGETSFSMTQSLFGGRDQGQRDVESAAQSIEAAKARERSVEARVTVDVAAACYAIASAKLMSDAAAKAMERYRQLLAVSEAKLAIGQVSQLDVLRAQRLVREAAGRLEDARANEEDARDALRSLVGGAIAVGFDVDVNVELPEGREPAPADAAVSAALEHSPEIQAARARVADAERRSADAHGPRLPRLDVTVALLKRDTGATLRSSVSSDKFHLVPFVQLALPDGSRKAADLAADLEAARCRRELRAAELKLETDVRRLLRQETRLASSYRDAVEGVSFAERQVDVARERFTRGLSNNLDLVSAETELAEAENLRFTTAASLAVARLQIRAATGALDEPGNFWRP